MDSDTMNKRNLIKQVSLIFLFSFYNQKILRSYILGIIEKENKVTIIVFWKIRIFQVKGVGRSQEYGTKWNVIHNWKTKVL